MKTFPALALRVIDTQADRIVQFDSAEAIQFFERRKCRVIRANIHDKIATFHDCPSCHSENVQKLAGQIRTELDQFSESEILALYQQGYLTCQQAIQAQKDNFTIKISDPRPPAWVPGPTRISKKQLEEGAWLEPQNQETRDVAAIDC